MKKIIEEKNNVRVESFYDGKELVERYAYYRPERNKVGIDYIRSDDYDHELFEDGDLSVYEEFMSGWKMKETNYLGDNLGKLIKEYGDSWETCGELVRETYINPDGTVLYDRIDSRYYR